LRLIIEPPIAAPFFGVIAGLAADYRRDSGMAAHGISRDLRDDI
jgi:hypothetical protein